jgi:hypothetical protein
MQLQIKTDWMEGKCLLGSEQTGVNFSANINGTQMKYLVLLTEPR